MSWNVSSTIKLRAYEYREVIEAIRNDKAELSVEFINKDSFCGRFPGTKKKIDLGCECSNMLNL